MRRRLLLLRRRWGWRDRATLSALARHDGAEDIASNTNIRRLLRSSMLRGSAQSTLRRTASGLIELATEMGDLLLIPEEPLVRPTSQWLSTIGLRLTSA